VVGGGGGVSVREARAQAPQPGVARAASELEGGAGTSNAGPVGPGALEERLRPGPALGGWRGAPEGAGSEGG
jgi:hypothetical protein